MTEAEIALIHEQAKAVFGEFLAKTDFKAGQIIVIGCSTSEVRGSRIGKDGNSAIAEALYTAVAPLAARFIFSLSVLRAFKPRFGRRAGCGGKV